MDTTMAADSTKFFLPTEEYLIPYPPIKVEETPLVYNQQGNSFGYMSYEDFSTATTTPSTSTSTSTGCSGASGSAHGGGSSSNSSSSSSNNTTNSSINHHPSSSRSTDLPPHPGLVLHQSFSEMTMAASPGTPMSCCTSPAPLATATASPTTPSPYYHPPSEFLQYSKESYEQQQNVHHPSPPTLTPRSNSISSSSSTTKQYRQEPMGGIENEAHDVAVDEEAQTSSSPATISNSELRRQIHIQSEQKRRAQIKDGFEDLRNELPSCLNKKMSKVALLHRTVQHIQHLKSTQMTILAELERLMEENEELRKFQQGVMQKQALDKIYQVNGL